MVQREFSDFRCRSLWRRTYSRNINSGRGLLSRWQSTIYYPLDDADDVDPMTFEAARSSCRVLIATSCPVTKDVSKSDLLMRRPRVGLVIASHFKTAAIAMIAWTPKVCAADRDTAVSFVAKESLYIIERPEL